MRPRAKHAEDQSGLGLRFGFSIEFGVRVESKSVEEGDGGGRPESDFKVEYASREGAPQGRGNAPPFSPKPGWVDSSRLSTE